MFNAGDKVVYPNHGIGIIEGINEFVVAGQTAKFFTVKILSSKSTVKIPASNAEAVGLRNLITEDDIKAVFTYLQNRDLIRYQDWKARFKENSDLMRTGKIMDMTVVLKNLHFVSLEKPLSFREKRMYDRSLELIASEIAEVRRVKTREIQDSLLEALAKAEKKITS